MMNTNGGPQKLNNKRGKILHPRTTDCGPTVLTYQFMFWPLQSSNFLRLFQFSYYNTLLMLHVPQMPLCKFCSPSTILTTLEVYA